MSNKTPLTVKVKDKELVICIGIGTLKFAVEHMNSCNPYDEKLQDHKQLWIITEPIQFAEDVVFALSDEREDGSTKLTDLIDAACLTAIENGSEAVEPSI